MVLARDEKWLILQPDLHKIANERKNGKKKYVWTVPECNSTAAEHFYYYDDDDIPRNNCSGRGNLMTQPRKLTAHNII